MNLLKNFFSKNKSVIFEKNEETDKCSININDLPNEIIAIILLNIPGEVLCKKLSLVCKKWKEIINSDHFWTEKLLFESRASLKLIRILSENNCYEPKKLYFKNPYGKNLIRNSCAEKGFDYWHTRSFKHLKYSREVHSTDYFDFYNELYSKDMCKNTSNENESWGFIIEPDDYLEKPIFDENKNPVRNYATSYYMCTKYQLIDLYKEGVDKKVIDKLKPKIEIIDFYAPRVDCGSEYHLDVIFYDNNYKRIDSFEYNEEIPQWSETNWRIYKRVIESYSNDIRYILFEHAGKDTQFWNGHYGIKLTNSSVRLKLF